MRTIDPDTWPRREHFKVFNSWDLPHFNLCANVDIGAFHSALKQHQVPLFIATVYLLARVANSIPEFRTRIQGDSVVEYEVVHPSVTVPQEQNLFSFCKLIYEADFDAFRADARQRMETIARHPEIKDTPENDDRLYLTAVPWVSFTSFMHPLKTTPVDSVPRLAWGKFFRDGAALKMPLSIQAHHALMDGFHLGLFYDRLQRLLDHPEEFLNGTPV